MRLQVGVVVCLVLASLVGGCRKGLQPTVDNNQAPETWITAAPQDTITVRDAQGNPISLTGPDIGRIPVRFHVYWAGSDKDGAVSGYYWAVVETLATPPGDGVPIPELPGPKPSDYHFTHRADTTFVFRTSELVSERQHCFYVYAVDDKGRPDPSPARFIFRAFDRFPPVPVLDVSKGEGTVYTLNSGGSGVTPVFFSRSIRDTFLAGKTYPADTVSSNAVLTFQWHGEPTLAGTGVTGFRYKLDEGDFNVVSATTNSCQYNTHVGRDFVGPGVKRFTLRAVGESGWRGETSRFFQMNFAPIEWISGPNLGDPAWSTYTDGNGKRYWYINVPGWSTFTGIAGSMLSPDTLNVLPSQRPKNRTFFEIYGSRLWGHMPDDTVHLNSWVILPAGGFDTDSPYRVKVAKVPPPPAGIVTTVDSTANGSPIGFRSQAITAKLSGQRVSSSETTTFPVFDPGSVYYSKKINAYMPMQSTGESYAYVVAEDGDGTVDRRLQRYGGAEFVYSTTADSLSDLRQTIMHFYVNHRPYLKTTDALFFPRPGSNVVRSNPGWKIVAEDADPIDYTKGIGVVGGPQPGTPAVLVRTVWVIGPNTTGGVDTFYVARDVDYDNPVVTLPSTFALGPAHCYVQVCDYRAADAAVGNVGRCSDVLDIPINITGPEPADATTGASTQSVRRPGFPEPGSRRQTP